MKLIIVLKTFCKYCRLYNLLQYRTKMLIAYTAYHAEVESRTQGSRPRPRPRTQKKSEAKAKDSLSEDQTSRGQGQECSRPRPRTKDTGASVLQKKKGLQNFFFGDFQFIGVARIFDCGRPKPKIT